jgi:uncharacterized small protein (DUF1192 family)
MDFENTATDVVETETDQEVVEPDESPEEGSNYEEVANPQSEEEVTEQSHEDNARFQEYRHRLEDAERERDEIRKELDELKAAQTVRDEVYSEYLDDEDVDSVVADALGISTEELNARIEERAEIERLKAENEQFKAEREQALQREQEARENEELTNQLAAVNKIDPSIKNVLDFENKFAGLSQTPSDYLEKGLTLEQAYWALKAEQDAHKRTPPPEVGGVKTEQTEKPFYSKDDVMAMTPEERTKHWKEIRAAQMSGKW